MARNPGNEPTLEGVIERGRSLGLSSDNPPIDAETLMTCRAIRIRGISTTWTKFLPRSGGFSSVGGGDVLRTQHEDY